MTTLRSLHIAGYKLSADYAYCSIVFSMATSFPGLFFPPSGTGTGKRENPYVDRELFCIDKAKTMQPHGINREDDY